ncbi:MAG: hypothetical protein SPD11_03665 [Sphaerochaetaceae bacterium]|nr:hypothetical protein [Sphaerochaetaceae bacterium]
MEQQQEHNCENRLEQYLADDANRDRFRNLVQGKALGASSNIRSIIGFMTDLAMHAKGKGLESRELVSRTKEMTDYFDRLRGDSSIAVRNAILLLTQNISALGALPLDACADGILKNCGKFQAQIERDARALCESSLGILRERRRIFVYDYSSSVDAILTALYENGVDFHTVISESRLLDGGYPFLPSAQKRGEKPMFVMEACMGSAIRRCDAAIIGAETLYAEGSVINTAGSDLVGMCCVHHGVPLYVATTFLKLDGRGERMFPDKDSTCDMATVLASGWPEETRKRTDFTCHGFSLVEHQWITGYFTERGYVSAAGIQNQATRYMRELKGDPQ